MKKELSKKELSSVNGGSLGTPIWLDPSFVQESMPDPNNMDSFYANVVNSCLVKYVQFINNGEEANAIKVVNAIKNNDVIYNIFRSCIQTAYGYDVNLYPTGR